MSQVHPLRRCQQGTNNRTIAAYQGNNTDVWVVNMTRVYFL